MVNPRKIAIVGAGAIGCYYGARLQAAGEDVHFLLRGDFEAVKTRGLRVRTPDEELVLPAVRAYRSAGEIGECDSVIVALKTTGNAELPKLLAPLLKPTTSILTLQNGLGSDEFIAQQFGAERVLGGLCFIAVNRTHPGEFRCLHPGSLSLGEFNREPGERVESIAAMFTRAGVRTSVGKSLAELRWKKLVWNVPFNGLSIAAGGITTDLILADPALENEARELMSEVIEAASKLGFVIPYSFIDHQVEVTRPMGPYKPSSLVDFLEGREVEVEPIWGEPSRRARAAGAHVPRLEMLYALIKSVTRERMAAPRGAR